MSNADTEKNADNTNISVDYTALIKKCDEELPKEGIDEYQRAATLLKKLAAAAEIEIPAAQEEAERVAKAFQDKYAPENLKQLDGNAVLTKIFYNEADNKDRLCYELEYDKDNRYYFGSIAGGSSFKFGLYKSADGVWTTGSAIKPVELTPDQAIRLGAEIRDVLVKGADIIGSSQLNTWADYEQLDNRLAKEVNEKYYNLAWIHKYFSIICSGKLSGCHSEAWQKHILRSLKIKPNQKYYGRSGQIALVQKDAGWNYLQFITVFIQFFGGPKNFVRIGSSDDTKNYSDEWEQQGIVAIGWQELGSLSRYLKGGDIDQGKLKVKLEEKYYSNNRGVASRKAGELARFYKCDKDTVFVIMKGEQLIALADNVGDYYFSDVSPMAHQRKAAWKFAFDESERLPQKDEGKFTACYTLTNEANLQFLYEKYYYGSSSAQKDTPGLTMQSKPVNFHTGCALKSSYSLNRIVFGAPGTGKSYKINEDRKALLGEDNEFNYERVTFHPDYSYAHFVGTYKPVMVRNSDGTPSNNIAYKFVPGPFLRVYVKALQSGRTEKPEPFLLIIEEINRANVAAVFGDVFQLLDRDDDGVSEYPIQASEDVKAYLADELGGRLEDYSQIKLPDNMFIWATMNSADQGVFPMDTAFKRRWDFTYLGIDDNDGDLQGKTVVLGKGPRRRVEWNELRRAINEQLASLGINEDKQLGPYFIGRKIVVPEGKEIDPDKFAEVFKNKVLMYLFEDAARQRRSALFAGVGKDRLRYSELCRAFDEEGIGIFSNEIVNKVKAEDVTASNETGAATGDGQS